MCDRFSIFIQYIVPQRALSRLAGWLSECRWVWLKNYLINIALNRFPIDLKAAQFESIDDYPNFNSFFTRRLKPELRPIVTGKNQIASPVDGSISQIGLIHHETVIQAKGFDFSLTSLFGGYKQQASLFQDGSFATIYLSPRDYHRAHMPISGTLKETIFIPGKLFSVNQKTAASVPQLFARNERLVCLFDTDLGPMAIILVGAIFVSSMHTTWPQKTDSRTVSLHSFIGQSIHLSRGEELGYFKMGSTAIVLFPKGTIHWKSELHVGSEVLMGQAVATTNKEGAV